MPASEYLEPAVVSLLTGHLVNGAQRQADGAGLYAENLRYDYLVQKGRVSFAESTGIRHTEESGSGRARILDATTKPLGVA